MPELPEVELVVQSLDKLVSSRRILCAELLRERLAPENPPADFARRLLNAKINFVHRRGKHILFDLSNRQTLITHLRMTGRFMLLPVNKELPRFAHAVFYFADKTRLVFQDQRHFGSMKIVETARLAEAEEIKKLAPEPFSDEFNLKYFRAVLKTSKRGLKEFLLDQTKVLGLGNIYASEALFLAKIHPQVPAEKITARRSAVLLEKIRQVLRESIWHGSNLKVNPENIDASYYGGGGENHWRVYNREGQPCAECQKPIARLKQGGRSTYFCPRCQKR